MGWVKSQLFWKIVGLYALLSLFALIGLLVTLNVRLAGQGDTDQKVKVQQTLQTIRHDLRGSGDTQAVVAQWQQTLLQSQQKLWLVDQNCKTITVVDQAPPDELTLRSVVMSATKSGLAVRRIRLRANGPEVLAFALDASTSKDDVKILLALTDPEILLRESALINSAATRSAVFTWLMGILCVAFVAAGLVAPLQAMSLNLHQSIERTQREDRRYRAAGDAG